MLKSTNEEIFINRTLVITTHSHRGVKQTADRVACVENFASVRETIVRFLNGERECYLVFDGF